VDSFCQYCSMWPCHCAQAPCEVCVECGRLWDLAMSEPAFSGCDKCGGRCFSSLPYNRAVTRSNEISARWESSHAV